MMIARFDSRAEEKKMRDFKRERRQAIESFILYDDPIPWKRYIRKYKIQVPDHPIIEIAGIMKIACNIPCDESAKSIANRWLKDNGFLAESEGIND